MSFLTSEKNSPFLEGLNTLLEPSTYQETLIKSTVVFHLVFLLHLTEKQYVGNTPWMKPQSVISHQTNLLGDHSLSGIVEQDSASFCITDVGQQFLIHKYIYCGLTVQQYPAFWNCHFNLNRTYDVRLQKSKFIPTVFITRTFFTVIIIIILFNIAVLPFILL